MFLLHFTSLSCTLEENPGRINNTSLQAYSTPLTLSSSSVIDKLLLLMNTCSRKIVERNDEMKKVLEVLDTYYKNDENEKLNETCQPSVIFFFREVFSTDFQKIISELCNKNSELTISSVVTFLWTLMTAFRLNCATYVFELDEWTTLKRQPTFADALLAKSFSYTSENPQCVKTFFSCFVALQTKDINSKEVQGVVSEISTYLFSNDASSLKIVDLIKKSCIFSSAVAKVWCNNILDEALRRVVYEEPSENRREVYEVDITIDYMTGDDDAALNFELLCEICRKFGLTRIRFMSLSEYFIGESFLDVVVSCHGTKSSSIGSNVFPLFLFRRAKVILTDPSFLNLAALSSMVNSIREVIVRCSRVESFYDYIDVQNSSFQIERSSVCLNISWCDKFMIAGLGDIGLSNLDVQLFISEGSDNESFERLKSAINLSPRKIKLSLGKLGINIKAFVLFFFEFAASEYKLDTGKSLLPESSYYRLFQMLKENKYIPADISSTFAITTLSFELQNESGGFVCKEIWTRVNGYYELRPQNMWHTEKRALYILGLKLVDIKVISQMRPTSLFTVNVSCDKRFIESAQNADFSSIKEYENVVLSDTEDSEKYRVIEKVFGQQ